jgi:chloramphenicol-sensitive protein RarD
VINQTVVGLLAVDIAGACGEFRITDYPQDSRRESLEGLTIEAVILAPVSATSLFAATEQGAFFHVSLTTDLLLVTAGPITAIPLLLFAAGARLVRLSTMGFLQYLAPSISLLLAVFLYHEPFTQAHAVTFALIWSALALVTWEALRRERYSAA